MTERLIDRVAAFKQKQPSKKSQNRAAFFLYKEEIEETLESGWSAMAVWQTLKSEGKIDFTYQSFMGYVNRHITHKDKTNEKKLTTGEESKTAKTAPKTAPLSIEKKTNKERFYQQLSEEDLF